MSSSYAFDSHLHLSALQFSDEELDGIFQRSVDNGVPSLMNVATDRESLERSWVLQKKSALYGIEWYQAAATTPHEASKDDPFFNEVEKQAIHGGLQAIGETGLDYFYEHSPKSIQKDSCVRYIDLALRSSLPLIIHCRDAFPDLFSLLRSEGQGKTRGVLHCFTGTKEDCRTLVDMGWYVSISGIVTYTKSTEELKEAVRFLPLENLLVETDAPYLAPRPMRGKKNEPSYLKHTLEFIAGLKGVSVDELARTTYENAKALFGETCERKKERAESIDKDGNRENPS